MATSPINPQTCFVKSARNRELLGSGGYGGGVLGGNNDTAQYWEILKRYFSVHNYRVQVPCNTA